MTTRHKVVRARGNKTKCVTAVWIDYGQRLARIGGGDTNWWRFYTEYRTNILWNFELILDEMGGNWVNFLLNCWLRLEIGKNVDKIMGDDRKCRKIGRNFSKITIKHANSRKRNEKHMQLWEYSNIATKTITENHENCQTLTNSTKSGTNLKLPGNGCTLCISREVGRPLLCTLCIASDAIITI